MIRSCFTIRESTLRSAKPPEWKDGHALRLDPAGPAIFIELSDPRCKFTGVWLHPDDVQWKGKP